VLDWLDAKTEFSRVEDRLRETTDQLEQAFNQNEKLLNALSEAREQIATLRDEVDSTAGADGHRDVGVWIDEQSGHHAFRDHDYFDARLGSLVHA
jgi:hypothetical protein